MKVRIARLGVLMAGVLGLLGTYMPPAEATTIGTVEFVIRATVGTANDSIAFPCFTGLPNTHVPGTPPVPLIDLALCLLLSTLMTGTTTHAVRIKPKPLPKHPADVMVNFQFDRPPAPIAGFQSLVCAGAVVNVNKPGKPPAHAGLCSLAGIGTVSGHCGLSTGTATGFLTDATNTYRFDVKFTGITTILLINGHVTLQDGRNGWIKGKAIAQVDPATGSCTNKHQLEFVVVGSATVLILN